MKKILSVVIVLLLMGTGPDRTHLHAVNELLPQRIQPTDLDIYHKHRDLK